MNQNRFWALRLAGTLIFLALGLILVAFPLVMYVLTTFGMYHHSMRPYIDVIQVAQTYAMRTIGFLWIFFLGSCFASFLNVVAWRVPRGRGVNGSSHCPHCDVKLRFTDNLPVIGWIRIGGMCRNCKTPITPRYLIVEIILGLIFVAVFSMEVLTGGANLPLRASNSLRGFEHVVFDPQWDLIQLWAFQMTLVCYLFTFSVIRSEKLRIPQSIFWFGILMGFGLPLIWPDMLLVPWRIDTQELVSLDRFSRGQMLTMLIGVGVGATCGLIVYWIRSKQNNLYVSLSSNMSLLAISESIACLSLVGLYLGWHSAVVITIVVMVLLLIAAHFEHQQESRSDFFNRADSDQRTVTPFIETLVGKKPTSNLSAFVLAATVLHILTWCLSNCLPGWPRCWQPLLEIGLTAFVLVTLTVSLHRKLSVKLTS